MLFSDVVESVRSLSREEKQEVHLLLSHFLREDNREEILRNFHLARAEEDNGELSFSADIEELRSLIER